VPDTAVTGKTMNDFGDYPALYRSLRTTPAVWVESPQGTGRKQRDLSPVDMDLSRYSDPW